MSVSKRLELLDHLSELMVTIHDNTIRLKYLCESNHEYGVSHVFDIENLLIFITIQLQQSISILDSHY